MGWIDGVLSVVIGSGVVRRGGRNLLQTILRVHRVFVVLDRRVVGCRFEVFFAIVRIGGFRVG